MRPMIARGKTQLFSTSERRVYEEEHNKLDESPWDISPSRIKENEDVRVCVSHPKTNTRTMPIVTTLFLGFFFSRSGADIDGEVMAVNPIARDGRKTKRPNRAADHRVSETDIEALRLLFKKLSGSLVDDGLISKDEFQLGLLKSRKSQSLFADRIFKMFDCNKDGMIEFQEFVRSLSVFHPAASPEEKTLFAFKLYDTGETGFIERGEVKELVCALLKESDLALPGEIVDAIIDRTFEDADQKRDGKIDIEEWKQFVVRYPLVLRNMTIPYLKDMTTAFPNFTVKPEMEDDSD